MYETVNIEGVIYIRLRFVGPMARCPEDLELVLPYISGPDGVDPMAVLPPYRSGAREVCLSDLKLAFYTDDEVWTHASVFECLPMPMLSH